MKDTSGFAESQDGIAMTQEEETLALTRALIALPSVTPADAGCQALMMERLARSGFDCTRLRFGEVENFYAERGSSGPLLVFAGHTDVVPSGEAAAWRSPPFEPVVHEGVLTGRGAADMKGSLAAMIVACEHFIAAHPDHPGRLGFLITSDEEGPAVNGTVRVMQWLADAGRRLDYCLVGEPSSSQQLGDTIRVGRRGSLNAAIQVHGTQGHVAYPELADNPIHAVLPALQALCTEQWDRGGTRFPPTSFQISNIQAGTGATNVIPGQLTLLCNFRFSTAVTAAALQARTEAILRAHGLRYSIEWTLSGEPFLTEAGALVSATCAAVREVAGITPDCSTGGGTSDGRFIAPYGVQVVELGPVNATIHQVNESVRVDDLPRLATIYRRIIEQLLLAPD
jgi:succinyl-diaminopimelate desuccinylase